MALIGINPFFGSEDLVIIVENGTHKIGGVDFPRDICTQFKIKSYNNRMPHKLWELDNDSIDHLIDFLLRAKHFLKKEGCDDFCGCDDHPE